MSLQVTLFKEGNLLRLRPATSQLEALLEPELSYNRIVHEYGGEDHRGHRVKSLRTTCLRRLPAAPGSAPQLATTAGFKSQIIPLLKEAGYRVFYKDLLPHPNPAVFEPRWSQLEGVKLFSRQEELLRLLVAKQCGRVDCYAGFGKTFLIHLLARVLCKAKIHVVTKSAALARGVYEELAGLLPSVGMVGGGGKKANTGRVMVYTADSLHKSTFDADIFIADEGHELATPRYIRSIMQYHRSKMFMLSASQDKRGDGADFELNGIFGPKIMTVTYEEGKAQKRVVPIKVLWREVFMDVNPCEGQKGVARERWGIWRNDYRNSLIVEDARLYDEDEQVLIIVAKIDHAMQLKYDLQEFTLVHSPAGLKTEDRERFVRWNLIPEDEPMMTLKRADRLKAEFEAGTLKKVIVTGVWNRGVNFRHLSVLIRADAGASRIDDTQIPGRVARPSLPGFPVKTCGIVHEYMDQFDKGWRTKARNREKEYNSMGFDQVLPQSKSKFKQGMLHGF